MKRATLQEQASNGVKLAFYVLAAIAWMIALFVAIGRMIPSSKPLYLQIVGWAVICICGTIMLVTMPRWIKILAGLLAYAVFNGMLSVVSGHLVNFPNVRIGRSDALLLTFLFAASAFLSFDLAKRKLTLLNRLGVAAFVSALIVAMIFLSGREVLGVSTAVSFLVIVWGYDHFRPNVASRWTAPKLKG